MQALAKHGQSAWLQAAQAIPRNTRTLYMHAVQSFLWNTAVSARLHKHGRHVVAGDLVMSGHVWPDGGTAESPLGNHTDGDEAAAPVGLEEGGPDQDGQTTTSTEENGAPKKKQKRALGSAPDCTARARMERVTVVTADDVTHERYSIDDVVLPLPGSDVQYPEWPTGTFLYLPRCLRFVVKLVSALKIPC